jgi:hypothetical protein
MFPFKNTQPKQPINLHINIKPLLTLSTCWYNIKSKFPSTKYIEWTKNFLYMVNKFNLVIYTNRESFPFLKTLFKTNPAIAKKIGVNIILIIKPLEDFVGYKYKDQWITNHNTSGLSLHKNTDWTLNMLWCEKVHFVNETITKKYFNTPFYGWCDIGYFRNNIDNVNTSFLTEWPNPLRLLSLSKGIHYACVENNANIYTSLMNALKYGPLPKDYLLQSCFAGGFFIIRPRLIQAFSTIFDNKLQHYFDNQYIIKDDQTILLDCIANNPKLFSLHWEQDPRYDNWFMFQRLLL